MQANDNLKDYLTCSDTEFTELCKNIALKALGLAAQQIESKKNGCQMIASEAREGDWRNMRKQMIMLRFFRDPEPVEDTDVREVLDKSKAANCTKAYIMTSSEFARAAVQFAENRPVELVTKTKLEEFLAKANS